MPLDDLCGIFPNLVSTDETITSPPDINYNCVSWASKDKLRYWEPFGIIVPAPSPPYYWPHGIPQDSSLPQTYIELFEAQGYQVTGNPDFENGFEKLALYVLDGKFTHVARQLPNGRWTSKLGNIEDITHDLADLEANHHEYTYGEASIFMRRRIRQA